MLYCKIPSIIRERRCSATTDSGHQHRHSILAPQLAAAFELGSLGRTGGWTQAPQAASEPCHGLLLPITSWESIPFLRAAHQSSIIWGVGPRHDPGTALPSAPPRRQSTAAFCSERTRFGVWKQSIGRGSSGFGPPRGPKSAAGGSSVCCVDSTSVSGILWATAAPW